MDRQSCNDLLAAYRHSVNLFKAAVQKGSGAVGDDSRLTSEKAKRLGQQCRDASAAFILETADGQPFEIESGSYCSG